MKMATLDSLFLLVVACVAAAGAEDNWLVGWLSLLYGCTAHVGKRACLPASRRGLI